LKDLLEILSAFNFCFSRGMQLVPIGSYLGIRLSGQHPQRVFLQSPITNLLVFLLCWKASMIAQTAKPIINEKRIANKKIYSIYL
jgi:hypothetical protein